jgi:hypothetical protein
MFGRRFSDYQKQQAGHIGDYQAALARCLELPQIGGRAAIAASSPPPPMRWLMLIETRCPNVIRSSPAALLRAAGREKARIRRLFTSYLTSFSPAL